MSLLDTYAGWLLSIAIVLFWLYVVASPVLAVLLLRIVIGGCG